jgi:hypothetical protein
MNVSQKTHKNKAERRRRLRAVKGNTLKQLYTQAT